MFSSINQFEDWSMDELKNGIFENERNMQIIHAKIDQLNKEIDSLKKENQEIYHDNEVMKLELLSRVPEENQ